MNARFSGHLLYSGSNSSSPGLYLSQGMESQNFSQTIQVVVADTHGASVSVEMTVKVMATQLDLQDLLSLTTGEYLL